VHVDDVLVIGQHQRFFEAVATPPRADLNRLQREHINHLVRLHRPRTAPAEAWCRAFAVLAEGRDHPDLTLLHDVEAAAKPDEQRSQQDRNGAKAGASGIGTETAGAIVAATAATAASEQ
jgi:hypothetical protein